MASTPVPPKPRSEIYRAEIIRLPEYTRGRKVVRFLVRLLARFMVWLLTRPQVSGLEHIPSRGPALLVTNHLGDFDFMLGLANTTSPVDPLAKAELYDYPVLGKVMDAYGFIWVHRGQPDRRALRTAIDGIRQGRIVAIAPEGRESVTGSLEEGTGGAAYLAIKSKAPILPVTFTGTENHRLLHNAKRFKRTPVSLTVGPLFYLDPHPDRHIEIENGTRKIMLALANQLPPEYRGVYSSTIQTPLAE